MALLVDLLLTFRPKIEGHRTYRKSEVIQIAMEAWEAAIKATEGNIKVETIDWDRTSIFVDESGIVADKKQYFKDKFNHDI